MQHSRSSFEVFTVFLHPHACPEGGIGGPARSPWVGLALGTARKERVWAWHGVVGSHAVSVGGCFRRPNPGRVYVRIQISAQVPELARLAHRPQAGTGTGMGTGLRLFSTLSRNAPGKLLLPETRMLGWLFKKRKGWLGKAGKVHRGAPGAANDV